MPNEPIYKITVESFQVRSKMYNVALTPELYWDDGALDFTGSFHGILIDPDKGTIPFSMTPDPDSGWNVEPKNKIDPNVMDELDGIVLKIKDGTAQQF